MIYALPFIAALIGWVTNFLAIKMLFHPRKPVKLLFFTIQGIFPKRQKKLAEKLGEVVSKELISVDDLIEVVKRKENLSEVYALIDEKIEDFLRHKLKKTMPMLGMILNDNLIAQIKAVLLEEINLIIPQVIENVSNKLQQEFDVKKIVEDKVINFSIEKLEEILFEIMKSEFKFIELVGAILGFLIGWIQILLLNLN